MRKAIRTLTALTILTAACGGDSDGGSSGASSAGVAGTCTSTLGGTTCLLYANYTADLLKQVETSCTAGKDTWASASACPTDKVVGTCAMPVDGAPAGFAGTVTDHYYGPGYTAATAESACVGNKGKFKAP